MNAYSSLGRIFWGELLVILDLRINGFDVLPDVIGYFLVALGCQALTAESKKYSTAATCSWILVAASIAAFFVPGDVALPFGLVFMVVDCTMVWFLLGGIIDYVLERERADLAQKAAARRIAYILIMAITMLAIFSAGSAHGLGVVAVVGLICMLIVMVMILHLIYRVRYEVA